MKKGVKLERVILTPEDCQRLLEAEKTVTNKKIYRRIQTFKMLNKGYLNKEVAEYYSIDITTVSNWIAIFREGGIEALLTLKYKGRPSRLSEEQISELIEEASKGSFAVAADLQSYIMENFGVEYSNKYIPEFAEKIGLSFKKTGYVPEKAQTEGTQKRYMK